MPSTNQKNIFLSINPDLPARGNANGLNSDDLDDEEDENDEESDELVTVNSMGKGSRLGGHQIRTTHDDSRSQSVLCMYFLHNHNFFNTLMCT